MSNDITTTSGRVVGQWDGEDVLYLVKELERIKNNLKGEDAGDRLTSRGVPHRDQFPEDLKGFTPYIIWGCDHQGKCLVGSGANRTETVERIREYYANQIAKDALARHGH